MPWISSSSCERAGSRRLARQATCLFVWFAHPARARLLLTSQAARTQNLSDCRGTAQNGEKMMQACPGIHSWHREVPHRAKGLVLFGGLILLFWGVGFGVWAALAPIASAVV